MLIADNWTDYELLDAADGMKLERWKNIILERPDPQVIWSDKSSPDLWENAHAKYNRSRSGGGEWQIKSPRPDFWSVEYKQLKFNIKPMGFKHTGLFPEQSVNWDFIADIINSRNGKTSVLNLFAYTGGATLASAHAGADVVHVDASKGMVQWAKENVALSGLGEAKIRYIVDDCIKFVQREIRRGHKYDAIIMDPPSYGRGPKGELWKFEDELCGLVNLCKQLLSDSASLFIINSYTSSVSHTIVANVLDMAVKKSLGGTITSDEICIPIGKSGMLLPFGAATRWYR